MEQGWRTCGEIVPSELNPQNSAAIVDKGVFESQ